MQTTQDQSRGPSLHRTATKDLHCTGHIQRIFTADKHSLHRSDTKGPHCTGQTQTTITAQDQSRAPSPHRKEWILFLTASKRCRSGRPSLCRTKAVVAHRGSNLTTNSVRMRQKLSLQPYTGAATLQTMQDIPHPGQLGGGVM